MSLRRVLIANRGEIAIRIARTAAELGIETVAVYGEDDGSSLHVRVCDQAAALTGHGPAAYLDIEGIVAAAKAASADAVHPGYGFLSENPAFAKACTAAGLLFVGAGPETLELFGDKARALDLAREVGAPCLPSLSDPTGPPAAQAFLAAQDGAAVMVKAVAGGGGRGMRRVERAEDLAGAMETCRREAQAAFGDGRLYLERFIAHARHIEVQVAGDGVGAVVLGDRECSLQRRNQKIIEVAPAIGLGAAVREHINAAALKLALAAGLRGLATVEFLLDADTNQDAWFIEVNPRLQVEHTVTEAVTGLDLVRIQFALAEGASLKDAGIADPPAPVGQAIELRVNLETLEPNGDVRPRGGTLSVYEPPGGPGVRVDGYGYAGYATHPGFDSLLAKVIVHVASGGMGAAAAKARRAALEFRIAGAATNLPLLAVLMAEPDFIAGRAATGFVEANAARLSAAADALAAEVVPVQAAAVSAVHAPRSAPFDGAVAAGAPLRGTIALIEVAEGERVRAGQSLVVLEAMKMQHPAYAPVSGVVRRLDAALNVTVDEGEPLVWLEPFDDETAGDAVVAVDLDLIRGDLAAFSARLALTDDAARPEAIAKRHAMGMRTARENIDAIFDARSFQEIGALAVAAQRRRRTPEDLRARTPADGMIAGVGAVNGDAFEPDAARCVGLAYDFTVLAGTQGYFNHKKTDRALEYAEHWKLPVIWFAEGGGGRPGDVDAGQLTASSLDTTSFTTFARLSGLAPRIAIAAGRCFAGNAVFFGCADVTIGVEGANIGLGGPAMIEGGGLGVVSPDEVGPAAEQWRNGSLDLYVKDEVEAARQAKQMLGYFQGRTAADASCADQRLLRHLIPENRVRVYDIRAVIETLADEGSFLELRGGYGRGMVTGMIRIAGRPMGLIANDPRLLGGAIDAEGAEKAGRFLQLCDAFDVPILSLCDTPGFMVGPESETTAAVRRGSRMFVTATSVTVPIITVVLRKAYGLGAQAMAGGDLSASALIAAWPTGEFGPMGLEGAVRLGYRKELEAETDPAAQTALFESLLARMYAAGKAERVAEAIEIDAVIDPVDTRGFILRTLAGCGPAAPRNGKKRPFVDVW
jgi:acetyl/propionyl-CoA carboxylase alpha subunit/acetyl-CoA carboxylase carboxyltransferase component